MDDDDNSRRAEVKIVKEGQTPFYQVRVKFAGHIGFVVRWDDTATEARRDVSALLRDALMITQDAFKEIDIDRAASEMDAELADLFNEDVNEVIFTPDELECLCSPVIGVHPECPHHGEYSDKEDE